MTARAIVATMVLLVGALAVGVASRAERVPSRSPLSELPTVVGEWQGLPTDRIDQNILTAGMLFTLFMGGIGGLLPAMSAMRLKPLDAIR